MVRALVKPGAAIVDSLTPEKAHLLHMAVGISGEIAELEGCLAAPAFDFGNLVEELGDLEFYLEGLRLGVAEVQRRVPDQLPADARSHLVVHGGAALDAVKKHVVYNKPLEVDLLQTALDDIEASLAVIRATYDVSREEVLAGNQAKLAVRYRKGSYSDQQAVARADKAA